MSAPFCATILAISLIFTTAQASETKLEPLSRCIPLMDHLFKVPIHKVKDGEYAGLSEVGVKELTKIRGQLLETTKISNSQLYSLEVVTDLLPKIAAAGQAYLFYGGPGSAKSLSANVILNPKNIAVVQVNPMTTKEAFIGGPTKAEMEAGHFNGANWKGQPAEKAHVVVDEATNANGTLLGSFGGMINEKKEFSGAVPLDVSNIQTWGFITNATLPQIQRVFMESGNGAFGPAFINRMTTKFYFHNWADTATRVKIAELNSKKERLEALSSSDPSLKEHLLLKSVPHDLNYIALREFAHTAFEITPETSAFIQDFADQIKLAYRAYKDEVDVKLAEQDKSTTPYTQTADLSDRIAGKHLENFIRVSIALDFLKSDLASDPKRMEQMLKKPIKINPISTWRIFSLMTTVLAKNSTVYDPFTQEIHFAVTRRDKNTIKLFDREHMINTFGEKIDALNFLHQEREREIFSQKLKEAIKTKTDTDKEVAEQLGLKSDEFDLNAVDFSTTDIEFALFAAGDPNLVHVKNVIKANE